MPLTGEKKKEYEREYKRKKRGMTKGMTDGMTKDVKPVIPKIKELETEVLALRAEVARLKQLLAGRPTIKGPEIHTPMRPTFTGSFSRAAQAKGQMPNRGPLGRMAEDNW